MTVLRVLASFGQTHLSIFFLKSKTPAISLAANLHRWQNGQLGRAFQIHCDVVQVLNYENESSI